MAGLSTSQDIGTDKRQEKIVHVGFGGCPVSVCENMDSFPTSPETFFNVYGPQFNTTKLNVVSAFENIFDIALVQLIVDETNKNAQQEISKSIRPLTFRSRIRKWEDVTNFTTCLHHFVPSSCLLVSFLETLCLLVVCHDVSDLLLDGLTHLRTHGFYCGFHLFPIGFSDFLHFGD
jgi:hypothetical protein